MSIKNLFKSLGTVFNSKVEDANEKMITNNPEAFLEKAIENEKIRLFENKDKLSKIRTLINTNDKNSKELVGKLQSIQALIAKYQREGNLEAVKAGNEKYELRYSELEILNNTKVKLEEAYESVKNILQDQQTKIDTFEAKKSALIGQLKAAESQEEAMDLLNDLNLDSNSVKTFERTEAIINKKINAVKGKLDVNEDLAKEDFFKGL